MDADTILRIKPGSGDIYEQTFVKSITRRKRDFSKHLFGVIL